MATTDLSTRSSDYAQQLSILDAMKLRREELQADLAAIKTKIAAQELIVISAKQQLKDVANAA